MANETTQRYLLLINELIADGRVSSRKDFAQEIGVSTSSITEITQGRTNVGLSLLQKTVLKFSDVNLDWLITGLGEIFKTKYVENVINENDNINDNINDTERNVQETLSFADRGAGEILETRQGDDEDQKMILNTFSYMTNEEIESTLAEAFRDRLLEMYETGRSVPAIEAQRYKEEIKELTAEVSLLKYKLDEKSLQLEAYRTKPKHKESTTTLIVDK